MIEYTDPFAIQALRGERQELIFVLVKTFDGLSPDQECPYCGTFGHFNCDLQELATVWTCACKNVKSDWREAACMDCLGEE